MGFTPSSMASMSMIGQIGGMFSNAIGSWSSASTNKINLQSQAALDRVNAKYAELSAQSALYQGEQQVASLTLQAGKLKSSQRAAMAANGIDLGVGNAAEVSASTDIMKEIDKRNTELNAVYNAFGYRNQKVNFENSALMKSAQAKAISPGMAAFGSLLGGATKVAESWYAFKQSGVGGWG